MAVIVVFENNKERAGRSAELGHHWETQKKNFGTETEKLLDACDKLFYASLNFQKKDVNLLLKKIFGIAKAHGLKIIWYGADEYYCKPDRFLVLGKGKELAFIQC